jgi:hypothetical protein
MALVPGAPWTAIAPALARSSLLPSLCLLPTREDRRASLAMTEILPNLTDGSDAAICFRRMRPHCDQQEEPGLSPALLVPSSMSARQPHQIFVRPRINAAQLFINPANMIDFLTMVDCVGFSCFHGFLDFHFSHSLIQFFLPL